MICPICGNEFPKYKTRKYCSPKCSKEAKRRQDLEKQKINIREYVAMKKKPEPYKPRVSIEEVVRRAKAEGLTYGQYVEVHREVG